jgi:hypothetical protein
VEQEQKQIQGKPFFLMLINLAAIAYYLIYWILFSISIFSNRLITNTLNHYSEVEFSAQKVYWFSIIGFLLSTLLLYGLWEIRKLKKRGYFIFISGLIISSGLATHFLTFDWISLSVNLFFLIIFSAFYKSYK